MRKGLKYRVLGWALVIVVVLFLAGGATWIIMTESGRARLQKNATSQMPVIQEVVEETAAVEELLPDDGEAWEEDWIRYNGKVYDYNENILTFLCMGIDVNDEITDKQQGLNSGQADAIFLLVLNPDKKEMSIIAIDRNTMTQIDAYDDEGNYLTTMEMQINLAHGYGDGQEQSAEYQMKAVSQLMYQLPIHGYCAVNMAAIAQINDAIGGVTVTIPEDAAQFFPKYEIGERVHLMGKEAYLFVKARDTYIEESARKRLNRQKQYLLAYVAQAKEAVKQDISIPLTLFSSLTSYMTTDITADEIVYLAGTVEGYGFSEENLIVLPGKTDTSGTFDEFYVDEAQLKQIIIDVFYNPVEELE